MGNLFYNNKNQTKMRRIAIFILALVLLQAVATNEAPAPAPVRRTMKLSQVLGCVGGGLCGAALAIACATTGPETVGAACLAEAGLAEVIGCSATIAACTGNRRLDEPKRELVEHLPAQSSRMGMKLSQILGCVGGGLCGAALAIACAATGPETVGAACLAETSL